MSKSQVSILDPGTTIGGCRIVREIGRGGMGHVYLAEHITLRRSVAVKVLPPDWDSPDMIQRFLKEARMCARIEHPSVVTIYDVGEYEGLHYIVMQYIDGKNLAELMTLQRGPLPWDVAVKVIRPVLRGLSVVHKLGLVHRDIKPANIMLGNESQVVLMDFGLVRDEAEPGMTRTGTIMGTPSYMPPEQCLGKGVSTKSDIYSVGATLYTLLTAQVPFRGTGTEVISQIVKGETPLAVINVASSVPRPLSDLVSKSMAFESRDRFPDAKSMLRALSRVLSDCPVSTPSPETVHSLNMFVQTEVLPELEIVDVFGPREFFAKHAISIAGATVVVSLLLAMLVFNLFGLAKITGNSSADLRNMVLVEAGTVRLGNKESDVRTFLGPLINDAAELERVVGFFAEWPNTTTAVPSFWIDRFEVTNAEYAKFLQDANRSVPQGWSGYVPPSGGENVPITNITHADAEAYALWAGKKLPTLEQWVRAYRGDSENLFPWGNEYEVEKVNVADNKSFPNVAPVTATPRDVSPFGVQNLVGNAAEYLRGTHLYQGRTYSMVKGAHYNRIGFIYGNATWGVHTGLDDKEQGVGFRCVYEP